MLHKSAAFSGVLSHSCPTRRATRSVVLSHKISTPPACWPGESKLSSGQLSTQSSAKNTVESRNARCWCASCPRGKKSENGSDLTVCSMGADYPKNPWEKKRKDISVTKTIGGCIGEIQGFTAAKKKNRLEVRGPLVPYRTSSLRAKRRPPLSLSFFHSAYFLALFRQSKAKLKWFAYLTHLTKGNELRFLSGFMDGFSQAHSFLLKSEALRLRFRGLGGRFEQAFAFSPGFQQLSLALPKATLLPFRH